jgi:hypothetical protein
VTDWHVELRPAARKDQRQFEEGPRRSAALIVAELGEEGGRYESTSRSFGIDFYGLRVF